MGDHCCPDISNRRHRVEDGILQIPQKQNIQHRPAHIKHPAQIEFLVGKKRQDSIRLHSRSFEEERS